MAVQASKSVTVTDFNTGTAFTISAANILIFLASGSNTLISYVDNRGKVHSRLVTESLATINTAAARTQAVTQTSGIIYINSDRIIYLDDLTANRMINYDAGVNVPAKYFVSESAASINTAAGNTFAITTQPSATQASRTRYINNLRIDAITPEAPSTAPVISFTTNVKTGTGVVSVVGTGYTNPTITITGGGGSGATATVGTKVITATVVAAGSGGTPGLTTFTGTTGTGTKFTCTGTIGGGGTLSGALTVVIQGAYGAGTPITLITAEPITGGSLTGATVSVSLGLQAVTITANGTGYTSYPTYTVVDSTGINGTVTAGSLVESPLVIVNGGVGINSAITLTFSATSGTLATATATVSAPLETVTATSLTNAGNYIKGTDTYPSLAITGGAGCHVLYDSLGTAFEELQLEQTMAAVQTIINAL